MSTTTPPYRTSSRPWSRRTRETDAAQLLVQLRLEDGQTLLARITRRSGIGLGIREGMLLYAQVKGVALLG
ncbi:MAG: TOBE domain-containing protein [Sedimenticolaceae bacterium]